jgi:hypothetical protein
LKELTHIELGGFDIRDYPEFEDVYISFALCEGKELTEAQLNEINSNHEFVREQALIAFHNHTLMELHIKEHENEV